METLLLIGSFLLLIVCFWVLHFTTDKFFIPSLDKIAHKYSISSDVAGSTLMAVGSSAPELAVALIAMFVAGNHEAIGIGTIVGSSLFNALIIVGYALIIGANRIVSWVPIYRDLIFYLLSVVLLYYFFMNGSVSLTEALILIAVYGLYILIMFYWKRWFRYKDSEIPGSTANIKPGKPPSNRMTTLLEGFHGSVSPFLDRHSLVSFLISIGVITLISWLLVKLAIYISDALGVPEMIIGLTVIAIGTSIPDLLSSGIVARRGRTGMAINNSIGSNVFDILIGLGLPILLYAAITGKGVPVENRELVWSFLLLLSSIALLFLARVTYKAGSIKLTGFFLVFLYLVYLFIEISGVRVV